MGTRPCRHCLFTASADHNENDREYGNGDKVLHIFFWSSLQEVIRGCLSCSGFYLLIFK